MRVLWGWVVVFLISSEALAGPTFDGEEGDEPAVEANPGALWVLEARIGTVQAELARSEAVARGERSPLALERSGLSRPPATAEVDGVIRRAWSWMERATVRLQGAAEHSAPAQERWVRREVPRRARLEAELRDLEVARDLLRARLQLAEGEGRTAARGALAAARAARERLQAERAERLSRAATTAPSP